MQLLLRSIVFGIFLLACVNATTSAAPPEKKPLAVADLYKFDAPRDATLAPDGKSLVYIRQWIDAKKKTDRFSLWRVDGDPTKAKAVEKDEPDARAPVFSPDGKWIAFLSTRARPKGWKQTMPVPLASDPATDIWLMPATGGDAIPLAGKDKPYGRVFSDGFYGRLAWSPDSTKLAFVADDGKDVRTATEKANKVTLVRDDQGEGYTGYRPAQIWVANLDAKPGEFAATKIDRLTNDDVWYGDPNWNSNGKSIAVHANRTTDRESVRYSINKNYDIWLIDIETKKLTQLTSGPGPEVSPRFSPDGKKIAFLSVPRKGTHRDAFNLTIAELNGAKPEFRVVFDHHADAKHNPPHKYPLFPLPADCWEGNSGLIANVENGVATNMPLIDITTGQASELLRFVKPDPDTRTLQARISLRTHLTPPGNLFLKERSLGEQKVISWKSDEFTIEGLLTLPPEGVATAPYKLIVYPHGGPHSRSTFGFDFTVQVFAARGYAVLQPNFRGSSGYGQKFIDADRSDFGGGDMRDIMAGVDKLIADGIADKDRLFVYGISYGGFMTSWLVGHTDRFRAAVTQNAVTDLNMMWSLSDIPSWTEWEFGGKPWEQADKYRKHSPLTYADKVTTPTLILHARDDRRCPLPMGQAFHKALKSRDVPTDLVIYPDEGHGIKQPQHREDVLNRVLGWFEKYDKK